MRYWIVIAALTAAPSLANASNQVTIERCAPPDGYEQILVCQISNMTDKAISAIKVEHLYTQQDRTVPWVDTRGDGPSAYSTITINGGIEPSETITEWIPTPLLHSRADAALVNFQVIPVQAFDVGGNPIP